MSYSISSLNKSKKAINNNCSPPLNSSEIQEISDMNSNNDHISNKTTTFPKNTNEEYIHYNHSLVFLQIMDQVNLKQQYKLKSFFLSILHNEYIKIISYELYEPFYKTFQIDCQINFIRTIYNVLSIKIIKTKRNLIRLFKQYERKYLIKEQRTFHANQRLFAFRNTLIEHIWFYSKSKLIMKFFLRKWYYEKYFLRYYKTMFKKKMRNHFLKRKAFYSEKKIDSIHLMLLYQKIKLSNEHYNIIWVNYITLIRGIILNVKTKLKKTKLNFLYRLKPMWNNSEIHKLKKSFFNQCLLSLSLPLSLEHKMHLKEEINKIKIRMIPEQDEENYFYTLAKMLPLFTKTLLIHKRSAFYFNKWHKTSRILEYNHKQMLQVKLTDLIIYSKLFLMVKSIHTSLRSSLCHLLYSIRRYNMTNHINIYQCENMTNSKLNKILNGAIKMYYFIHYSKYYNQIASKKKCDNHIHWNQRNHLFYKWKHITNKDIPYHHVIGLTLLNEYYSDLCYKFKYLFFAMLKSTETKVKMLSKVNILINIVTDIIQVKHLPLIKYSYWKRFQFVVNQSYRNTNYIIRLFIKKIKVIYTRELMKKIQFEQITKSMVDSISMSNIQQLNSYSNDKSNDIHSTSQAFLLLRRTLKIQQIISIFIRRIQHICFDSFYSKIKAINHSYYFYKKAKQTIDSRIYQNMATVTHCIHLDIQSRTKLLKRLYIMKKIYLITERYQAKKNMKLTLNHLFMEWRDTSSISSTIRFDRKLHYDLNAKIAEYQKEIDHLQDILYEIPGRCDQCKKCSMMLIGNSMSNMSANFNDDDDHIGISQFNHQQQQQSQSQSQSQQKKGIQRYDDEDEDDLEEEFNREGVQEYQDYLNKRENEEIQKMALLQNTQQLIIDQMKQDIDLLYNEIDQLSDQQAI